MESITVVGEDFLTGVVCSSSLSVDHGSSPHCYLDGFGSPMSPPPLWYNFDTQILLGMFWEGYSMSFTNFTKNSVNPPKVKVGEKFINFYLVSVMCSTV